MEAILEKVKGRVDGAEVFYTRAESAEIGFEGWKLKSASMEQAEGYALRVSRDGRVGFAATTDPDGLDQMIENALATVAFGEQVDLTFPKSPSTFPEPDIFDPRVESLPLSAMKEFGRTFISLCEQFRDVAELGFEADRTVAETRIINSEGLDASYRKTALGWGGFLNRVKENDVFMVYDGSAATHLPDDMNAELTRMAEPFAEKLRLADNVVDIRTGKLPVLFHPRGSAVWLAPLQAAINGRTVYSGTSPWPENKANSSSTPP